MEELHGGRLLADLDALLESDLEIDELGFLLTSQMMELHSLDSSDIAIFFSFDEDEVSADHSMEAAADKNTEFCFWLHDHKLAISVTALRPLYRAAQAALLVAQKEERRDSRKQNNGVSQVVDRILKATRALVIVNSDNNSAWNARKRIIVSESSSSPSLLVQELRLTGLVLSYAPKSEETWSHRRWIVSRMLTSQAYGGIIGSESKFVGTLVQRPLLVPVS